eukprot:CAMPEP_0168622848 /NCGR_PEP_ID=MMETSP0449_2-20121227/8501_1 /TAXON_ID=1082188 /ORGANISM="Strombidium rassoulzadegani, Strain ras09" /LENGTH=81 /DNA_ID=CAMNT_0008664171 /DNA_START=1201 /DNA_END=1443 /DNA_ORIENTATION=-
MASSENDVTYLLLTPFKVLSFSGKRVILSWGWLLVGDVFDEGFGLPHLGQLMEVVGAVGVVVVAEEVVLLVGLHVLADHIR